MRTVMLMSRRWCLVVAFATLAGCQAEPPRQAVDEAPVVFVCEHGSAKSLIAASLFDRAAAARGMDVRAISRGLSPDEHVPPRIAAALRDDGFDVEGFRPERLSSGDIAQAARVIAIGVDLAGQTSEARASAQSWDDVPAASIDYGASRLALERHITTLLDELQSER